MRARALRDDSVRAEFARVIGGASATTMLAYAERRRDRLGLGAALTNDLDVGVAAFDAGSLLDGGTPLSALAALSLAPTTATVAPSTPLFGASVGAGGGGSGGVNGLTIGSGGGGGGVGGAAAVGGDDDDDLRARNSRRGSKATTSGADALGSACLPLRDASTTMTATMFAGGALRAALDWHVDQGDVQTAAVVVLVIRTPALFGIDEARRLRWLVHYAELLQRLQLFTHAIEVAGASGIASLVDINKEMTLVGTACSGCGGGLYDNASHCSRCHVCKRGTKKNKDIYLFIKSKKLFLLHFCTRSRQRQSAYYVDAPCAVCTYGVRAAVTAAIPSTCDSGSPTADACVPLAAATCATRSAL